MFMNFESSFLLHMPIGVLVLFFLLMFVGKYLKTIEFVSAMKELMFHFYSLVYPGVWIMLVLFVFILMMNVFGLVPGTFSMSSLPLMTLGMGLLMWGGGYLYCIINNYSGCVSHFLPQGAPMLLSVVLVWIEIISWLCRPLALGVRLMANITAGHLLMFLCGSGVFFSGYYFMIPFIFLLALVFLEVGVSFIQSYVYQLLLSLYMQEGLE
uniref:ATP synthase subunit a n=1 Tax=Polycarpa mytiligera TaxID=569436 RepID=S0DG77_POLMY|nr:ATP synthase F0 subunit 6 [Polycarpa mytiligera]CCO25742.1 ATPase subunit 6 [Polycarpa mytiligera]